MTIIYLDNSATTPVEEETLQVMNRVQSRQYGNPSSLHALGLESEKILEQGRRTIADLLKVRPQEMVFTSGGTESNNLALYGSVEKRKKRGNKLITCKTEHPSVLERFRQYQQEGFHVVYLDVDKRGHISLDQLEEELDETVLLVSLMHVNNETGVLHDLEEIGRRIKKKQPKTLFHSDCIQSFGKLPLEPEKWQADLVSLSAHKMLGPKGCGALYVKKGTHLQPILLGGGQEGGLRSGTENVAAIAGWNHVLEQHQLKMVQEHFVQLKQRFLKELEERIPEAWVNSPMDRDFANHIISVSFSELRGEVLLHALERRGVYVSTGSACSSKKNRDSHVLTAMGLEKKHIGGTLRFSFSALTTLEEVVQGVEILAEEVAQLRKFTKRR